MSSVPAATNNSTEEAGAPAMLDQLANLAQVLADLGAAPPPVEIHLQFLGRIRNSDRAHLDVHGQGTSRIR